MFQARCLLSLGQRFRSGSLHDTPFGPERAQGQVLHFLFVRSDSEQSFRPTRKVTGSALAIVFWSLYIQVFCVSDLHGQDICQRIVLFLCDRSSNWFIAIETTRHASCHPVGTMLAGYWPRSSVPESKQRLLQWWRTQFCGFFTHRC